MTQEVAAPHRGNFARHLRLCLRPPTDNRLLGGLINIVVMRVYEWSHFVFPAEDAPKLPLGGQGQVFGYDNDYENHHFIGVTTHTSADEGREWFTAVNYRALVDTQYYGHARCAPTSPKSTTAWMLPLSSWNPSSPTASSPSPEKKRPSLSFVSNNLP